MDEVDEAFGHQTYLMAFFLKTRWNLSEAPGQLSYENHVDTPIEQIKPLPGETAEEHEDYLRFRSRFPGSRAPFIGAPPRRWSLNRETGESGPSSFGPYVTFPLKKVHADSSSSQVPADSSSSQVPADSSSSQVPADSSSSQEPIESSNNEVPVESSDNQGPPAEGSTSSTERSSRLLVVDNECELVPSLQRRLGAITSGMSYFMRACRSCEQSLQDKINDLPKSKITAEHVDNAELCSVCMENFNLEEEVKQLPCSHLFHGDCISPWLKKRQTCPICRKVAISAAGRAKVKLHRYQPYHRRRQSNFMLFEPPHWRF